MEKIKMKFEIEWQGNFYDCEWFDDTDFEKIDGEIRNICGLIFDSDKKICLVKFPTKETWSVPGGHPEKEDKTFEDTFIREVNEEVDLDLKNIKRLGYFKAIPRGNFDNVSYALRFIAEIEKVREQTIDPAEGVIPERKFVNQRIL
jgi:ADP-ribose pyrophosphatase YjhB (NUDIX family)